VRIARDGTADAPVRITIGVNVDEGVKFKLAFDDPSLPGLPRGAMAGTPRGNEAIKRVAITDPSAVAPLIASLRKASKLIVTRVDPPGASPSDPVVTEISLTGFAAAMLWIDEQQKRVGTVTAVIGRGDKPASAVPPLPAAAVVRVARIAPGPAPKMPSAAVLAKARKACDAAEELTAAEDATRLGGDQVMYWFRCEDMSGAYNLLLCAGDRGAGRAAAHRPIPVSARVQQARRRCRLRRQPGVRPEDRDAGDAQQGARLERLRGPERMGVGRHRVPDARDQGNAGLQGHPRRRLADPVSRRAQVSLVSRFRSSQILAAPSDANFGFAALGPSGGP
jgi:Protein of unknown function (DUF1176)